MGPRVDLISLVFNSRITLPHFHMKSWLLLVVTWQRVESMLTMSSSDRLGILFIGDTFCAKVSRVLTIVARASICTTKDLNVKYEHVIKFSNSIGWPVWILLFVFSIWIATMWCFSGEFNKCWRLQRTLSDSKLWIAKVIWDLIYRSIGLKNDEGVNHWGWMLVTR